MKYSHLDPALHEIVDGEQPIRERHVFRDVFIEHATVAYVLRRLEHLYRFPRRIRMPCMVIGGDSGMGKTTLLRSFQRRHPETVQSARTLTKPVVYVQAPSKTSVGALSEELVLALGGPAMDIKSRHMRRVIRELLAEQATSIILFDEVQHVARLRRTERLPLLDWFKELSTNAQIPVVCAGVRGVEQLFNEDRQLKSRFSYVELSEWHADSKLAAFLRTYERTLPLKNPSHLASRDMMKAILKEAGNNTDQIVQCLSMAALKSIRSGEERITPELLVTWRDPPLLESTSEVQP